MSAFQALAPLTKVLAYVTREVAGERQLLVFRHRDYPKAGVQVPAGTVEDGESIESALLREVEEETGLSDLSIVRKLGVYDWINPENGRLHMRHLFHLAAPPDASDSWQWIETSGGEVPDHEGYVFCFYWASLSDEIELAGDQGDYLEYILGPEHLSL